MTNNDLAIALGVAKKYSNQKYKSYADLENCYVFFVEGQDLINPIAVDKASKKAFAFNPLIEKHTFTSSEIKTLPGNNTIEHSGLSKRKNVKYIARVNAKKGKKKYIYFYTKEAYAAYLKNKNQKYAEKNKDILSTELTGMKGKSRFKKRSLLMNKLTTKEERKDMAKKSIKKVNTDGKKAKKMQGDNKLNKKQSVKNIDNEKLAKGNKKVSSHLKDKLLRGIDKLTKKKKELTNDQDARRVNPKYNPANAKTAENCGYCALAYHFRRKGYDVEAIETDIGTTTSEQLEWYKPKPDAYSAGTDSPIYMASLVWRWRS